MTRPKDVETVMRFAAVSAPTTQAHPEKCERHAHPVERATCTMALWEPRRVWRHQWLDGPQGRSLAVLLAHTLQKSLIFMGLMAKAKRASPISIRRSGTLATRGSTRTS